ncbi:hypothetical protein [Nonomuraea sp. NEAU-A123]
MRKGPLVGLVAVVAVVAVIAVQWPEIKRYLNMTRM